MKSRTKRFPRSAAWRAAVPLALVALGCHAPGWFAADARNQPGGLAGEWVDSSHTTPTDTALWVLEPGGEGKSRHFIHPNDGAARRITEIHYGHWYVKGALADSLGRRLCFTNRPGRSAATCLAFDLDTSAAGGTSRRRLLVHAYPGEHHTGDRVLLSRAP